MEKLINEAIALLDSGSTFIAIKDKIIIQSCGLGVKPIIEEMRDNQKVFKDAIIVDKIIGKAAALLLVLSGARFVYGRVMSKTAVEVLKHYQVDYQYGELVEVIQNRSHTGLCPLEDSVKDTMDPQCAYYLIEERIMKLMKK